MAGKMSGERGRHRKRNVSVSSASSSDSSYMCERGLESQASGWKKQDLESLGIFYNETAHTATEILDIVKKLVETTLPGGIHELPDIAQNLIELMKQVFQFSLDFNEADVYKGRLRQLYMEANQMRADIKSHMSDFKRRHFDMLQDDRNDRIYQAWVTHALDFLQSLRIFTVRFDVEDTREEIFTELFRNFTRLCFLHPESGDSVVSHMTIKGKRVSGNPDVRFPDPWQNETVGITIAEIKQLKEFTGNTDIFHIEHLSDGVLGQHGVELLLEYQNSVFKPEVSGIICIGTKIIFTFLKISRAQYTRLQETDTEEEMKLKIRYSKPFDYMDSTERSEILEILFWLGYVQSDAYDVIAPK